ncbi:unnamed protein product [Haemonchus placei]|uniref:C2H2-type domain-containing protein n=1 Tax=Haemonchus placei TaxID=6290 RepID=A0A0N4X219_HAEPC|nr:unnamed protein product [Haemonchus placei]
MHGYSKHDVQEAKNQRRRWLLFTTASASYICDVCNRPYKSKKALRHHRREKEHNSGEGQIVQVLLCPLCDRRVLNQEELYNHVNEEHAAALRDNCALLTRDPEIKPLRLEMDFGNVMCPECYKFFKREHIGEHAVFVHNYTNRERQVLLLHLGVELTNPVPELTFKCEYCQKNFGRKQDNHTHVLEHHADKIPSTSSTGSAFMCIFDGCSRRFNSNEDLVNHCARIHSKESGQQFKIISASFDNMAEFLKWKSDVGKKTCATFCYRCTGELQTVEYVCATFFMVKDDQESQHKRTKTPENRCTAFIKCRPRSDGTVEAIGCMDHTGHSENLDLFFSDEQREELRAISSSPGTSEQSYACFECDKGSMTLQKLEAHIQEVHEKRSEVIKDIDKTKDVDLYYTCGKCRFVCFTATVMDVHIQPWLDKMEKNTGSVLVKSSMQACGTKLIHSYDCKFDKAASRRSSEIENSGQFKSCPAFVKIIENEDGVLDCVGFFDHFGHGDKESQQQSNDAITLNKENMENKEPCFLCGNDVPPEVDGQIADCVKWLRCNVSKCRSRAHECYDSTGCMDIHSQPARRPLRCLSKGYQEQWIRFPGLIGIVVEKFFHAEIEVKIENLALSSVIRVLKANLPECTLGLARKQELVGHLRAGAVLRLGMVITEQPWRLGNEDHGEERSVK